MSSADAATPCQVCVTRKVSPASWRIVGETCSHVDCPNRRPLTAAPRDFDPDAAVPAESDPWR